MSAVVEIYGTYFKKLVGSAIINQLADLVAYKWFVRCCCRRYWQLPVFLNLMHTGLFGQFGFGKM